MIQPWWLGGRALVSLCLDGGSNPAWGKNLYDTIAVIINNNSLQWTLYKYFLFPFYGRVYHLTVETYFLKFKALEPPF